MEQAYVILGVESLQLPLLGGQADPWRRFGGAAGRAATKRSQATLGPLEDAGREHASERASDFSIIRRCSLRSLFSTRAACYFQQAVP